MKMFKMAKFSITNRLNFGLVVLMHCLIMVLLEGCAEITIHLDPRVQVSWNVSHETSEITFRIIAKTTNYIGFGFSNGGMANADIVIGGIEHGKPYFHDYHGPREGNSMPQEDDNNNYKLLFASENGTHTKLKFSRDLDTCDFQDIPITATGVHLIWAIGSSDKVTKHHRNNVGTKNVYLLDPELPPVDLSQFKSFEIKNRIQMPGNDTTYWCTLHYPTNGSEIEVVAFDIFLPTDVSREHVHHLILHICSNSLLAAEDVENWTVPKSSGVHCYMDMDTVNYPYCQSWVFGWAKGGELFMNPIDVGSPLRPFYYKMEVHLDNPYKIDNVTLEYGIKIYYTEKPRLHKASTLTITGPLGYKLLIPPATSNFVAAAHCDPKCFSPDLGFLEDGIKIYNVFLHSHLSGRKLKLRHFRKSKELPPIIVDNNFDFNYQTNRRIANPVVVLPGDQLTLECTYDSTWKNEGIVIGGLSTSDEMCMFVIYTLYVLNEATFYL